MGPVALSPWVTVEPCVGIIWTIIHYDYDMLTMNLIIMMMPMIIMPPCLHGLLLNPVGIIIMMLLRMLVMYMVVMVILVMYMMMKLTSPRKMLP